MDEVCLAYGPNGEDCVNLPVPDGVAWELVALQWAEANGYGSVVESDNSDDTVREIWLMENGQKIWVM